MFDKGRYGKMKYNRCGNSGLKLPAVSLGLWHNFGSVDVYANMKEIAFAAFDMGITHFDLANNYGPIPGSAEENFGRILKDVFSGHRDELVISTKAGYYMWEGPYGEWGSRKYLTASLDQSLKRMGVDYVDIFYSHRFDPETPLEETMGALDKAVKSGKALYAGISNYNAEQTKRAKEIMDSLGSPLIINQPCYNMLSREPEKEGLFTALEKLGMGCIAYSPLAQGRLTEKYLGGVPEDSRAAKPWGFLRKEEINDELIAKVKRLKEVADGRGQTIGQLALAWALKQGNLTSVLVGASRKEQLFENVKSLDNLTFTGDEMNVIDDILEK